MADKATTGAESPLDKEIEITEEMLAAGCDAIASANAELVPTVSYEDLAERVYLAMVRLALKGRP